MLLGQIDSAGLTSAPLIPINDQTIELEQSWEMSPSELLVNMGTGMLDDFYPSVAIASLMKILRDPTLNTYHAEVVQAVTYIFRALGIKSVPYIPQVIPSMIKVIRQSDPKLHDNLFPQLGVLISIVRQHIRNYLDDIFELIIEFWNAESPLQPTIIGLVENISMALGSEFKIYLPKLVPQILGVLSNDTSRDRHVTEIMLHALKTFGGTLSNYLNLVLHQIVALFDNSEVPARVSRSALECIDHLTDCLDFSPFASLIIHPLVRCLDKHPDLRPPAMDALASLVSQLGKKYLIFIPMVQEVLIKHKISHQKYDVLTARIEQGGDFDDSMAAYGRPKRSADSSIFENATSASSATPGRRPPTSANLAKLQEAWTVDRRVSKDDWLDWYNRLCSELLKASPSPALLACWKVGPTS